ncbi:MAG: nucleotidyltransferase domain-containing protein [bacterium]|nr:nucleotidyltransferase domain-containing protein [bacterium]
MVKRKIPKNTIKIVKNYTDRLSREENLPIKKIIIFGSYAKEAVQKWSDIDICIISPKFKNTQKTLEFLWTKRKREEVLEGLEPIGFSEKEFEKGSDLIKEIKRTGVIIK